MIAICRLLLMKSIATYLLHCFLWTSSKLQSWWTCLCAWFRSISHLLSLECHGIASTDWLTQCSWLSLGWCWCFDCADVDCCCCHRLASKGHSVAPRWPRLTVHLQRSAGGRLLSFWIWSTRLLRGRPGRQCHWLLGGRPRDWLNWQLSALWAGMSSGSLATWPKRALRWRLMVSEMDGRPMVTAIASLRTNWCHLICSSRCRLKDVDLPDLVML